MYVTDAHSYIWFLTEDQKLSKKAKEVFESCDRGETVIVVPSIILLEILHICEKQKVQVNFSKIIDHLKDSLNYVVYPLDIAVILECQNLTKVRELHDRVIVATSKLLGASLITKDENIKESGCVEVVW